MSLLYSWHCFYFVNTWSTVLNKGYFCDMYTEHLSQKNCWSILVLQCHIIYIYIIWHCKNTVCMYMNGKSLWNSFSDEWKKNRKTDFGWNEICMKHTELEASLNQSFLFSSTQCNMSESSIYIATNLLHIMVYNTSIILMQSCETLLCALLVINSWKTANMHKTVTHHSLLY